MAAVKKKLAAFDPTTFLAKAGDGRTGGRY